MRKQTPPPAMPRATAAMWLGTLNPASVSSNLVMVVVIDTVMVVFFLQLLFFVSSTLQ